MKICETLPQFLNENFWVLAPKNLVASKLAIGIGHENAETSIFSLSEVASSDMLWQKITTYPENDIVTEASPNGKNVSSCQIESRCSLAQHYLKASQLPYAFSQKLETVAQYIFNDLNAQFPELLAAIDDQCLPRVEISPFYNIELLKLIFQMRHHLFNDIGVKLCHKTLFEIFNLYEILIFDANTTTDVFLTYGPNKHAHLRVKCNIVFGLNLYHWLQKESQLNDFKDALFGKKQKASLAASEQKPNEFDSDCVRMLPDFTSLRFIKPLFSIVEIGTDKNAKTHSIKLNSGLSSLSYRHIKGDSVCLFNSPVKSSKSLVSFLNLFNEGNGVFRKAIRYSAVLPTEIIEDLDAMISAVIQLFPEIESLLLVGTPKSQYNEVYNEVYNGVTQNTFTYFDMLLDSLLSKSDEALRTLTEFLVHGYNVLALRTVLLLKQCSFDKFGIRGIFSSVDELYLYLLFRKETKETLAQLQKIYANEEELLGVENELLGVENEILGVENDSDAEKYNNLRNSVTHLVGTEKAIRLAAMYCFAENLKSASAYLQGYNNNYELYAHEKLVLDLLNTFRRNFNNVKQTPLSLQLLEVYPEHDHMEGFITKQRKMNRGIPIRNFNAEAAQNNISIYKVSELIVANSVGYPRTLEGMRAIGSLLSFSDSIEIYVTTADFDHSNDFLECLVALGLNKQTLILSLLHEQFTWKDSADSKVNMCDAAKRALYNIYHRLFKSPDSAALRVRFYSHEYQMICADGWGEEVLKHIVKLSRIENRPCDKLGVLKRKIHFEI
ncbi:hypothetical protein ENBRE01_1215 [Enteropsectra breve]|nr:hypothetical protein ENBRE01_1215 [Enteropsectra breve]